jgi:RNA 3'-terminal phosphate cyclase (ATP)
MIAGGPSTVILEGGTHNPMAPPFDFLLHTFLPIISRMGPVIDLQIDRYGFYPKGGGLVRVKIQPSKLARIDIPAMPPAKGGKVAAVTGKMSAQILLVNLPRHIADREKKILVDRLPELSSVEVVESSKSPGAGNMIAVHVQSDDLTETITALGERGLAAEKVAESAVASVRSYLKFGAPVGDHLADQLLLPMALAGAGSFITSPLTEHTRTNIRVIKQFLDVDILAEGISDSLVKVTVCEHGKSETPF